MTGTVSNILEAKKFGFISGENGQEYFFHMADTEDWDKVSSEFSKNGGGKIKVSFDPIKTPKGPRAKNVSIVEES